MRPNFDKILFFVLIEDRQKFAKFWKFLGKFHSVLQKNGRGKLLNKQVSTKICTEQNIIFFKMRQNSWKRALVTFAQYCRFTEPSVEPLYQNNLYTKKPFIVIQK